MQIHQLLLQVSQVDQIREGEGGMTGSRVLVAHQVRWDRQPWLARLATDADVVGHLSQLQPQPLDRGIKGGIRISVGGEARVNKTLFMLCQAK